jgi:hypothetical protein
MHQSKHSCLMVAPSAPVQGQNNMLMPPAASADILLLLLLLPLLSHWLGG